MAKYAELPDGTRLEFPDNTADNIIDSTVKKHLGVSVSPQIPEREVSGGDVYGASFLSGALGLSRAMGGAKGETLSKAQKEEESKVNQYEEENPNLGFIPSMAGKMTVYGLAAAPGLVVANPITGTMGALGTAAVETGLAGIPVGMGMGGEQYQRVLDATGDEQLARKAAITTGAVNALGVGLPASLGGGLLKRMAGGLALNIGAGEADIATQNAILAEHPELQQEQFSGKNMLMSGLMGAGFGALSPRKLGNKPAGKTTLERTPETKRLAQNEIDYAEDQRFKYEDKRERAVARLNEIEKARVNGEVPIELLDEQLKLEAEVNDYNERIAALKAEPGEKIYGKTDSETPPKTDAEVLRSDDQPATDTTPSVRGDFDEKMEGVSRESDVPPMFQREDREVDGIPEREIIKEEARTNWQQHKDGINEKINQDQETLDHVNDKIREMEETGNTSPYLDDLYARRERLENRLEDRYQQLKNTDTLIAVESGKKAPQQLSTEELHSASMHVINDVLLDRNIPVDEKPIRAAERIAAIYGKAGDDIHFVGVPRNKDFIVDTVKTLHNITGQKDKVIVIQTPAVSKGSFHAVGNTAVMFVSPETRRTAFDVLRQHFNKDITPEKIEQAALLNNIGHEYGHFYMTKLVQAYGTDTATIRRIMVEFEKYKGEGGIERLRTISSMPLAEKLAGENYAVKAKYFEDFPEYFAEAFNRAVNAGKLPENPFLRDMYTGLRKVTESIYSKLRELGILISKEDYTSQAINDILASNKKFMESAARTMHDNMVKSQIDTHIANNKAKGVDVFDLQKAQNQIHEYFKTKADKDYVPIDTEKVVAEQREVEDGGYFSMKGLSNFFGFPQVKRIFEQSPLIRAVSRAIDNADFKAESAVKALLHNVTDYNQWKKGAVWKGFVSTLKHYEDKNSVARILQDLPEKDFANLEVVFRKGFEESLAYSETLQKYGHMMTEEQRHAFTVLSTMFENQWKLIKDAGIDLPQRKGWYPSVRQGNHFVELKYNGVVVFRQQVRTEAGAKKLAQRIKETGKYSKYELNFGKNTDTRLEMDQRAFIIDAIQTELAKKGFTEAHIAVEDLIDRLESKPKLGKHHEQRMNILGYKGTEILSNEKDLGLSFKEAIKGSVEDFTGTYRKILISRETNQLLNTPNGLDESHPNTFYAARLMRDMATNKVTSWTENFDNWFKGNFDNLYTKLSGKESKLPVFDKAMGVAAHLFYIKVLTMKAGFWLSQTLSSPLALRQMLRETSIVDALGSAGKGTFLMTKPDEGFLRCVYWLSQNTNSYHPALINELTKLPMHEFLKEGTVARKIAELMTGETPSSMADSFSRYWTSAMMYAHYTKLGYKGEELYRQVSRATDDTMIRYEKRYRAPGIQKLGMLGEQIAPLHTFAQAQWGNMVADFVHGKKTGNWAPLVSTFLVSLILGGVAGMPLIADYLLLRQAFGLEDDTPDPIELALQGGGENLAYGILSNTGFDLGSSLRTNPLLPALLHDSGSLLDLLPVMNGIAQTASGSLTMAKRKLGGDVSDAEYRNAALQVLPKGWPTGIAEDVHFGATERSMVPTASGAGLVEQTGKERAATYLGIRTMENVNESQAYRELTARDKALEKKVKRQIDILGDAVSKGDDAKKLDALLKLEELGVRDKSVLDRVQSNLSGRERSLIERYILGNKGKGTGYESRKRLFNFGEYGE